jgi:hypothetical protein
VYPTDRNNYHIEARSKITDAVVRTLGLNWALLWSIQIIRLFIIFWCFINAELHGHQDVILDCW